MEVYLVIYGINYEGSNVVGVFSDYVKAREFEIDFIRKHNVGGIKDYDWSEVRKVEVNKDYEDFFEIGEAV